MFVVNRTAEVGQDPGNEAKGKGSVTADDGGATEDKTESLHTVCWEFTLNVFFFFCRTVPCSIQQCWTRPPHRSELHFDLALFPLSVVVVEDNLQICQS